MRRPNCIAQIITQIALWVLLPVVGAQAADSALSSAMALAIERAIPGASLVTLRDVDSKSCRPIPKNPGLVRADFDGDHRADFAVLLRLGQTGKVVNWQGSTLTETQFAFAIFLDDGNGRFIYKFVRRFVNYAPVAAFIDIQEAGKIRNRDQNRDVVVPNPAIMLVFCEKSASAYYLSSGKVRRISVVD